MDKDFHVDCYICEVSYNMLCIVPFIGHKIIFMIYLPNNFHNNKLGFIVSNNNEKISSDKFICLSLILVIKLLKLILSFSNV